MASMKFSRQRLNEMKASSKNIKDLKIHGVDEFPEEETRTSRELRALDSKSPTAVKVSMTIPEKHRVYFTSLVVICVTLVILYIIHKGYLEFLLSKL